jgi:hypothetical protein
MRYEKQQRMHLKNLHTSWEYIFLLLLGVLAHFLTLSPPDHHFFSHWSNQDSTWSDRFLYLQIIFHGFTALLIEAVCTSETSVYFDETKWYYIPEGCNLK